VWLRAGVHELIIFAASKQGSSGLSATRARANSSSAQPQLKPFNKADFDLEAAKKYFGNEPERNGSKATTLVMDLDKVELQKETEEFAAGELNKVKRVHHWQKPGDWLKWAFNAQQPGAYEVWVNSAHIEGGSLFRLEFGDQMIEATVQKTGDPHRFSWQRVGLVQIDAAGSQILTIKPLEIVGAVLMDLSGIELRPASGAGVIQRDREWEFFFDPVQLRYARFQVDEYLGDSVAINHIEVANIDNVFIPTEVDVSTLAENSILEIAGGDVVLASYTDETSVATRGGSRLLTQKLQATYNDARVVPIGFDFERNAGGGLLSHVRSCLEWILVTGLPLKWLIMIWIKPINGMLFRWQSG